jgi:SGNH hydrolase-like domain, acetyltransferase AlgX
MGLLVRHRRPFALVLVAGLAVPAATQLMQPVELASEGEARMLAPAPGWPRIENDWLSLPRRTDRFLSDHFGLRTEMVRLHGRLRYAINLPSDLRVVIGRDQSLFLAGDATIDQAMGVVLRTDSIAAFADRAAALRAHLAGRGAQLLVAIPPNSATINRDELPAWAGARPAVTEYDLMLQALAARDVPAVDLRAADGRQIARPDLPANGYALEQVRRPRGLQCRRAGRRPLRLGERRRLCGDRTERCGRRCHRRLIHARILAGLFRAQCRALRLDAP